VDLKIDYRLVGTGWADCALKSGDLSCRITASYLSDALGDLVLAALAAVRGFRAIAFSFEEEPGEYRWVITTPRMNEVDIAILEFDDLYAEKPDSEGRCLFKVRCRPSVFAQAVADAAKAVLDAHGESGYRETWGDHPFPAASFSELTSALARARY
jgi:hypothetical protein